MAEFGRAGKGAKLLRVALRSELQKVQDRRASNRLLREMVRLVKTDALNPRGERNLTDAEKSSLAGFEFNATARLGSTFFVPFTSTIDRASYSGLFSKEKMKADSAATRNTVKTLLLFLNRAWT